MCLVFLYRDIDLIRKYGEVKLHLCLIKQAQHHKDVLGSGSIISRILNHGTGWR